MGVHVEVGAVAARRGRARSDRSATRILHAYDRSTGRPCEEQLGEALDARGVATPDGSPVDDLPLQQLDPVVLAEQACLGDAVIVLDREPVPCRRRIRHVNA